MFFCRDLQESSSLSATADAPSPQLPCQESTCYCHNRNSSWLGQPTELVSQLWVRHLTLQPRPTPGMRKVYSSPLDIKSPTKGSVNNTYWYCCVLWQDFASLTHSMPSYCRDRKPFNLAVQRLSLMQLGKLSIWAFVVITKLSTWGQHVLSFEARRSAVRSLLMISCEHVVIKTH